MILKITVFVLVSTVAVLTYNVGKLLNIIKALEIRIKVLESKDYQVRGDIKYVKSLIIENDKAIRRIQYGLANGEYKEKL